MRRHPTVDRRDGRWWLAAIGAAVALGTSMPAAAYGQCLASSGAVSLCDTLDGTTSGAQQGGTFIADGWQVDGFGNQITWDLGAQVAAGTLRFYVRGITLDALNRDNHHFVEVFDHEGGFAHDAKYFAALRTWSNAPGNEAWFGRLKFQFGATQVGPAGCGDEANLGSWAPNVWQPDRWFEIEFGFAQGTATLTIDGVKLADVDYGGCDATLRFINIPNDPWVEGVIDPIVGAVYSTVSFDGVAACEDPCSDGDPCTESDTCQGAVCVGTPVADGTACDDGTCQHGVCVGGASPDGGAVPDGAASDGSDAGWVPVADSGAGETGVGEGGSVADARVDGATHGAAADEDEGGCGCRLASGQSAPKARWWVLLSLLALARRRRLRPTSPALPPHRPHRGKGADDASRYNGEPSRAYVRTRVIPT